MISKKDAEDYLNQMLQLELQMKKTYLELSEKLSDTELKNQFIDMAKDEQEHADLVNELKKLLEVYWRK